MLNDTQQTEFRIDPLHSYEDVIGCGQSLQKHSRSWNENAALGSKISLKLAKICVSFDYI